MNSCLWILLLLGCCGNSGKCGCSSNTCGCIQNANNCSCNNECGCNNNCNNNLIQPRMNTGYGCHNHNHHHDDDCSCKNNNWNNDCDNNNRFMQNGNYMSPPPVPGRMIDDDCNCGCDD